MPSNKCMCNVNKHLSEMLNLLPGSARVCPLCQLYKYASCLMVQVEVGHVRLLLPCGKSQSAVHQEEAASPAGPTSMERSNSERASVDMDMMQQAPNMLVIVLAGFQANSRTTGARVSNFASPGKLCWLVSTA